MYIIVQLSRLLILVEEYSRNKNKIERTAVYTYILRTTVLQDVQTRFSVQLAFDKFLSKIKGNF